MLNSAIPAKAGTSLTTAENKLLADFRGVSDDYQETAMQQMQILANKFPRQRPALSLVRSGDSGHERSDQ